MLVDMILKPSWVIPVSGDEEFLTDTAVVINNGEILDLIATKDIDEQYQSKTIIELSNQALMPGLINAHTHSAMALMRGIADDKPLQTWLEKHIWPVEMKHVSEQFVFDGTQLACAEMLLGGTTCFNDMYFFPEATAKAAKSFGMRASVGAILIEFPSAYAKDAAAYLEKGKALINSLESDELINATLAPHAPYTVSDESFKQLFELSELHDLPINVHLHETEFEVNQSVQEHGYRPFERLNKMGLLNKRLLAVHMTSLSEEEIAIAASNKINIVHCPESNMKLASGICPTDALNKAGVNIALGTDGAASNNDLDMFGEMRSAAMLAKVSTLDATALGAHDIIKMATINGAKALGIAEKVGSIEVGKQADLISVDLSQPATQPVYNPVSQIVYAAHAGLVSHVWVQGNQVVKERQFTHIDIHEIMATAKNWHEKISAT